MLLKSWWPSYCCLNALSAGLPYYGKLPPASPGYAGGEIGRNVDDAELWVLTTRWANVGSYRRALSSYDVKLRAVAVLSRAIEEPSAYEDAEPGTTLNLDDPRSLG